MRLVGPRAASAAPLLLAAAAAALVTTVSLTAFVLYAYLLPQAGVRQAVADAPPLERSVLLISGSGSSGEDFTARDRAARELFADDLAGVPLTVYGGGAGISQRLPDDLPGVDAGPEGAYALVGFLEGLEEHAELVTGAWPQAVDEDEPAQVALPREVAEDLGLSVGERVEIVDEVRDLDRPVVVTGVWEARNPSQAYWALLGGISTGTGQVWGPFVVHPDEYLARYQRLGTLEWVAVADPADLARAGMPQVAAAVADLQDRLQRQRDQPDSPLDDATRVRTGLDGLAERLTVATVVNRSGLVLPAALLGVIAAYGLVLVARLLAAHRRGENALLRARGASRRQLVRLAASEAVLALGPAALAGAPAGTWLVRVADANAGGRSLGLAADLAPYGWAGPPLAWLVAVVAAAGCAVALATPAAGRGRTWVAEQQERSRPGRAAVVQRAGVDVALVVVAGLAWWQLRQYGQAVTPRSLGGLGVDPLLVAAPVLAVLAATAVALRLLPLATRLGVRLAGRRDAFSGLLGMWQADRRPHAGPVLLLVLAVATSVLAPTVAATWQQSQKDQAAHAVGADLRLEGNDPRLDPQVRQLADMPQVDGLAAVHRTVTALPDGRRVPVLAIDSDRAAQVVRLRQDLAPDGAAALFGVLHEGRPQVAGIPLPEDARRL
ncbi:MAG TPA: FtsX-like permease family protein, partial [Natronosporangium sp.]|nr:FtsX-like permease family protein [Natronosporangium sp.]